MNLEQCLDVHFAGEFVSFALEVLNDEKKQEQFAALIAELPVPKRGEFWRSLLVSVRNHHRDHLDATYFLAILAISTWMDLSPIGGEGDEQQQPPQSLLDLLTELHDSLFELSDEIQLQEDVASLCERWYLENRPLREYYLPQLIPTLVMISFDGNANRVFAMRHALMQFDFADGSNDMLKSLLLKCFLSPVYLKSPKGKRVLSFIMSLNRDMMLACHLEMQQFQTKSLEPFAQVYFDTWMFLLKQHEEEKGEDEDVLEAFENDVIQNELVHGALYQTDVMKRKACLKMLDLAFHENKREKRVDSLLCRIYTPLVFTGLNATNAEVRRNSATLLFNAFPLHDPYSGVQEIAALLDQQFLAIESLLFDFNPECRACAADGVCRLLALFWETIPKSRCSKFLQILINDLAFDKTAPMVRQAVFMGLSYMLDFPLCHAVLRNSIRFLQNHFHDRALTVRIEFAKLLVKLDNTVGFAFTEFVQLEDVLHRLVLDSGKKSLKLLLCKLLVPVFFPKDTDNVEQLKRARLLASTNPEASKIFFSTLSLVCNRDEWNRIVKLVLLFGSFVNARRKEIEQVGEEEDVSDVESAIHCICALWEPIAGEIATNALYESSRERLGEMFDAEKFLLPLWNLRRFELLQLCKLIGPGCQALEKKILKRLYVVLGTGVDLEVDLICSWNGSCVQRVLKECVRSLNLYLQEANGESVNKKRLGEGRAVRILSRIVFNHECTAAWELMEQEEGLKEFWQLLDLARSMPHNRVANALVLLEIKIGMQREDDSALRWVLMKIASEDLVLGTEMQRGVFMLAADCTALGFSLVDLGLQLLRKINLDVVQTLGMDRFVLRLLQFHPDHKELCDLVCELVAEPGKATDEFLLQWFRINPKQVFRHIVLGNGDVATHLIQTKPTQIFGQALLALEQDPQSMLGFVQAFVQREGWDDKTTRGFAHDLVKFSDRVGGLLGDQTHNIASELTITTM
ncbi:hypothetical protein BASA81_002433 [Batrachochytrium salamandrivorans]|nr:hypothetical protein BASA81_002433 [Batrachochytrium salamandrivorans]